MVCVTERRKPGINLDKAVRVLAGDIYLFDIKMLQTFDGHHAHVSDKSSAAGGGHSRCLEELLASIIWHNLGIPTQ